MHCKCIYCLVRIQVVLYHSYHLYLIMFFPAWICVRAYKWHLCNLDIYQRIYINACILTYQRMYIEVQRAAEHLFSVRCIMSCSLGFVHQAYSCLFCVEAGWGTSGNSFTCVCIEVLFRMGSVMNCMLGFIQQASCQYMYSSSWPEILSGFRIEDLEMHRFYWYEESMKSWCNVSRSFIVKTSSSTNWLSLSWIVSFIVSWIVLLIGSFIVWFLSGP